MPDKKLDHILIVRGGEEHLFSGKGKGGLDLQLLKGIPEPLENFAEGFADQLLEERAVIRVNENGTMERSGLPNDPRHRHPDVLAKEQDVAIIDGSSPATDRTGLGNSLSPASTVSDPTVEDVPQEA